MLRDKMPRAWEERTVVRMGKCLWIPSTAEDFPARDPFPDERVITKGELIKLEEEAGAQPYVITSKLGNILYEKTKKDIVSELWAPVLYNEYVVGYIQVWNTADRRERISKETLDFVHQFAKVLCYSLVTNGYFKVESSTARRYEAPIIDMSASGLLFAHTSADLAKELLVHTDLELYREARKAGGLGRFPHHAKVPRRGKRVFRRPLPAGWSPRTSRSCSSTSTASSSTRAWKGAGKAGRRRRPGHELSAAWQDESGRRAGWRHWMRRPPGCARAVTRRSCAAWSRAPLPSARGKAAWERPSRRATLPSPMPARACAWDWWTSIPSPTWRRSSTCRIPRARSSPPSGAPKPSASFSSAVLPVFKSLEVLFPSQKLTGAAVGAVARASTGRTLRRSTGATTFSCSTCRPGWVTKTTSPTSLS